MTLITTIARSIGWARALIIFVTASVTFAFAGFILLFVTKDRVDAMVFYTSLGASSLTEVAPGQGDVGHVELIELMRQRADEPRLYDSAQVQLWRAKDAAQTKTHLGAALVAGDLPADGIVVDQTALTKVKLGLGDTIEVGENLGSGCRVKITGVLTPLPSRGSVSGASLAVIGPDACPEQGQATSDIAFDRPGGTSTAKLAWDSLVDAPAIMLPTLGILAVAVGLGAMVAVRSLGYLTQLTAFARSLLAELGISPRRVRVTWLLLSGAGLAAAWACGVVLGALTIWYLAAFRTEPWHFFIVWLLGGLILYAVCLPLLRRAPETSLRKD